MSLETTVGAYKYFTVELRPRMDDKRKTRVFKIRSTSDQVLLGIVRWENGWRQYVFCPRNQTIWSVGCLEDLRQFLGLLKAERKSFETADETSTQGVINE